MVGEVFKQIEDKEPDSCSFCGQPPNHELFYIANPEFTCTLCSMCIELVYNAFKYAEEHHDDAPPSPKKLN